MVSKTHSPYLFKLLWPDYTTLCWPQAGTTGTKISTEKVKGKVFHVVGSGRSSSADRSLALFPGMRLTEAHKSHFHFISTLISHFRLLLLILFHCTNSSCTSIAITGTLHIYLLRQHFNLKILDRTLTMEVCNVKLSC